MSDASRRSAPSEQKASAAPLDSHLLPLDPTRILEDTLEQMAADLEARKAVVLPGALPCPVKADPLLLQKVLMNLLRNAITFVGPGIEPKVRITGEERGPFIRIAIEDNGIGIALEDHGRISRCFERLDHPPTQPGTEIGLAIVKRSLERMGGRVGFDSVPGRGSRFWCELRKG